jgi:hypothetical protein
LNLKTKKLLSRYDGNIIDLEKLGKKKEKIKEKQKIFFKKTTLNKFVIFFYLFTFPFEQEHICTLVSKAYIEIRYRRFFARVTHGLSRQS